MVPLFLSLIAVAVSPTQVPTVVPPSPTSTTAQDIQKIRDVVSQKVKEKLKQITAPSTSKLGYLGKIVQIDPNSIGFDSSGVSTTARLSSDLTIIDLKRNKAKIENLKVGQDVLILGIKDNQQNSFEAKRIIFTNPADVDNKHLVVIGKIVDISRSSPIFSLIPLNNKNTQYQIKTDTKTIINSKSGQVLLNTDLKSGDKIITILVPDPKMTKTYYVKKIIDLSFVASAATGAMPSKAP